jgi:RNA polymerase sigma-70 factor, ECF subfamily
MKVLTNLADDELLRLMASESEQAFTALYQRRQGAVYRFTLQMSGSPSVAEEVTQEVFLILLHERSGYDPARGIPRGGGLV